MTNSTSGITAIRNSKPANAFVIEIPNTGGNSFKMLFFYYGFLPIVSLEVLKRLTMLLTWLEKMKILKTLLTVAVADWTRLMTQKSRKMIKNKKKPK